MSISIFLVACKDTTKPVEKETYMMGTIIDLKVYGKNAEEATEKAVKRVEEIENKMSVSIETSEISMLNAKAGMSGQKLSAETYSVIEKAVQYSKLTEGAFDPTIEPIVKLWGIGTDAARVPSKDEITEKLKLVGYKDIILDGENSTAQLKRTNQAIDLGAIAKGYTADEIKGILLENKISSAIINLGGNIYAMGNKLDGTKWNIGIQNPLEVRGKYLGTISISDKSVVTSGNYERFFMVGTKRYHHIFDPKNGYPSENGIISTTIISDKSIDGDVLSTSTYIMGIEKAQKLVESIEGVEAIFITDDKKIYVTSGIKDSFKLTDKGFTYEEGR
ncbi:FAD:protein FMN transferase [Clostridium sp.]|uniref:FAD:protein FMN transferase n=1 Tax=Clostridium sp. TaxID=1506 RepID=UPI0025C1C7D8|nr:FAD:protein FMN transferase [Clostridium sp.]